MWPFNRWFKRGRVRDGVRPYGLRRDDGVVQLVFTLPVPPDAKAREMARQLVGTLGFDEVEVVSMEAVGKEFSAFVVYGKTQVAVDPKKIQVDVLPDLLSADDLSRSIQEKLKRPLTVVGATLGNDTYSTGMDLLVSMRGDQGSPGLEFYTGFRVAHMRGKLSAAEIVERARSVRADVVLVAPSREDKSHLEPLREFAAACKSASGFTSLVACVDTHLTVGQAKELGYADAFAPKTSPAVIANAIAALCLAQSGKSS